MAPAKMAMGIHLFMTISPVAMAHVKQEYLSTEYQKVRSGS